MAEVSHMGHAVFIRMPILLKLKTYLHTYYMSINPFYMRFLKKTFGGTKFFPLFCSKFSK